MLKHFFDNQKIYIECFQFWKQKLKISNWLFSQVLPPCFISKTILIPSKYKDREWRTYVVPCTVWFRLFKGLFFVVGSLHLNSSTNYIPPLNLYLFWFLNYVVFLEEVGVTDILLTVGTGGRSSFDRLTIKSRSSCFFLNERAHFCLSRFKVYEKSKTRMATSPKILTRFARFDRLTGRF